jgi:type II restriction/modification system DNA methylase subunit YeeA
MDTSKLKKFAVSARQNLIEQVSNRLKLVLAENSAARREHIQTVKALESALNQSGQEPLIERVAYIWFNRFCALRFMDVNRYTRIGVVSPAEGQFQPEILAEAKMGHIDDELADAPAREKIFGMLDGKVPSSDPQSEAYRHLLVAACNDWHKAMPYLFEKINDYTELLMPDDLLSGSSILASTREALTPEACQDVEVIGWLYQFYISEKKDEVFVGLKKNQKITPENIPAATQLFTPHWIVRYLVENSLGRLWMLNHPQSRLIEQMEYYIKPEEPETDFLKITSPEEFKICDPACGSGHMLTYAFDLLYAIYEESGYEPSEIPEKILSHNLYGIEIDERAGELAAFALTMKARAKQRRFFLKPVHPNICVLENIVLGEDTLKNYARVFGKELFTDTVVETLQQFREARNFGSLIIPKTGKAGEMVAVLKTLKERSLVGMGSAEELSPEQLLLVSTPNFDAICIALKQVEYLSPKYHVVIANPPYMGGKGMNGVLGEWAKKNYPDSKSDLFAMFMERNLDLCLNKGSIAMITMQSWMFLSSFESLRSKILDQNCILSMAHFGARAFDSIGGEVVQTTAFILNRQFNSNYIGSYLRLIDKKSELEKEQAIREALINHMCGWFYHAAAADFKKIPGSPIAYWTSNRVRELFKCKDSVGQIAEPRRGLATNDNPRFIRYWPEVSFSKAAFGCSKREEAISSRKKWFPYNKGGEFRKWYGNNDYFVNWENDGEEMFELAKKLYGSPTRTIKNLKYYFREGVSWSMLGTGKFSVRKMDQGFIFDQAADSLFTDIDEDLFLFCGLMNSLVLTYIKDSINPTINTTAGVIAQIPYAAPQDQNKAILVSRDLISDAKQDWDSHETSWEFTTLPLLQPHYRQSTLRASYLAVHTHWQSRILKMKRLEEENNFNFIEAYGLQGELTPEVPLNEITLACNPHYRYGGDKSETELESLLLSDTMKEFISYAVGCMFGRYALEKPGLILANQGETFEDYVKQIPNPSFPADKDNVVPILDGDWFTDDITERFRKFLRLTFGEEHYAENLKFIEEAIGKDLRKYFLKDFYSDHVKRYKKRPIYWLFSSPKGSFNALIYMHRYQPDTVSIVLNDYLREFNSKLTERMKHLKRVEASAEATKAEKTQALKEIESLRKTIEELDSWERDVIYPLATEKIAIDLDDGVKVNYTKFGAALKKIPGLEAKDED